MDFPENKIILVLHKFSSKSHVKHGRLVVVFSSEKYESIRKLKEKMD